MTFEQNAALSRRFNTAILPWLIGLGALVVYLVTLCKGTTVNSVGIVAQVSGWNWQPELRQPLAFLLYLPFRFLPEPVIPMALNVFNAVLAALTVTLLARAVALLPHDRTSDQRDLEDDENGIFSARSAWIPPVLAALAFGLQISFWECATAASTDMIDAFVFAYVVRCLLEFCIDRRPSWMYRAAFVYAVGVTNNWALIGLAPIFLMAIIWSKGVSFFNGRFLLGMFAWGMAGLSLYLLLPALAVASGSTEMTFWDGLTANLITQKRSIAGLYYYFKDSYRFVPIGATSLLPLFFISLKWRSSFGDTSPLGIFVTKTVFHIVHALFFVVCLLTVLSPPFSPRQMLGGLPFLNHSYLCALVVGYCAGYFLLICGPALRARVRTNPLFKFAGRLSWSGVVLMLFILPAALIGRNLQPIQLTNGDCMDTFLSLSLVSLPKPPATLVSDDSGRLALARSFLVRRGDATNYLFYDTQSGGWSDYHVAQLRSQGGHWPDTFATLTNSARISPLGLMSFLGELVNAGPACYLEPSFGYYFERFELMPRGLAFEIAPCPTNTLLPPPLGRDVVEANEKIWNEFDQQLLPMLAPWIPSEAAPKSRPKWQDAVYDRLHLSEERVSTAEIIGRYCSRAANYWAVELQKREMWPEAAVAFKRALILNPDNVAARINLAYNEARQAGKAAPVSVSSSIEEEFDRYQDWNFDEPRFTFEQGRTFFKARLYRQALQSVKRVVDLDPSNYTANVWLADMYTLLGKPADSLSLVRHIRDQPAVFELDLTRSFNLDRLEATALFRSGDTEKARALLLQALAREGVGTPFRASAAQLFLQAGLHAEAVPLLEQVSAAYPADVRTMANLGFACLQLEQFDRAQQVLTSALELDPTNSVVRLNRAITLLRAKKFDAAREDYQTLEREYPKAYQIQFGLGEIAAASSNSTAAIAYFEECLKLTPVGTPDYVQVSNRLATARGKSVDPGQ